MEIQSGINGQRKVVLSHVSGAAVEVYLHGATITSYKLPEGREILFLSSQAVFDGAKAIRGGIPIVFPQFGGGVLPQHGFARNSLWSLQSHEQCDEFSKITLTLSESEATLSVWPFPFTLSYEVAVGATSLSVALRITNTGMDDFPFQALLHPYFAHSSIESVKVKGLRGFQYLDKVSGATDLPRLDEADEISITSEFDSVYINAPDQIVVEMSDIELLIQKSATVASINVPLESMGANVSSHGTSTDAESESVQQLESADAGDSKGLKVSMLPSDIVVWNPWVDKSKSMADFDDEGYRFMVCVEPGIVSRGMAQSNSPVLSLKSGATFSLTMTVAPVSRL